jgi:hypothetical protein
MNNRYIQDLIIGNGGVLVYLLLGWGWLRSVNGGRSLRPSQKKMLLYSFVFILGMVYLMMFGSWLHLPPVVWFIAIGVWGVVLVLILWRRHKRTKRLGAEERATVPARVYFSVGLPFLGVLVSLIMSAIEWDFVAEGQGHVWQALAWTAALAASIWLARQNRRAAVVMAFRVFLVLGVIGALGHPSAAVFVALGLVAVVYFLIERLWPKPSNPAVLDFEALSRKKPN